MIRRRRPLQQRIDSRLQRKNLRSTDYAERIPYVGAFLKQNIGKLLRQTEEPITIEKIFEFVKEPLNGHDTTEARQEKISSKIGFLCQNRSPNLCKAVGQRHYHVRDANKGCVLGVSSTLAHLARRGAFDAASAAHPLSPEQRNELAADLEAAKQRVVSRTRSAAICTCLNTAQCGHEQQCEVVAGYCRPRSSETRDGFPGIFPFSGQRWVDDKTRGILRGRYSPPDANKIRWRQSGLLPEVSLSEFRKAWQRVSSNGSVRIRGKQPSVSAPLPKRRLRGKQAPGM